MKVLIVGGGGREHALAWKVAQDPNVDLVVAAPGSDGMAGVAKRVNLGAEDIPGLVAYASGEEIDLTLVGPEAPLAAGIVDAFRADGLRIFGPDRAGARLEASKAFTKEILVAAGAPTAAYRELTDVAEAKSWARELGAPLVVKADGLAAGKGVVICETLEQADAAIESMLVQRTFGDAGSSIVIEEFLPGEEASFMALTDGRDVLALASSQDHKAALDGDLGPNTGGMGAYSPAPVVDDALHARVLSEIIEPTVGALRERGIDYRGVLYAGLMIVDGNPKVLEYNVRFGDPECQPILSRLDSSLVDLLGACIDGDLASARPDWKPGAAACVVMASGGYPAAYRKGDVITGIDEAERLDGVQVFHAGTARDGDGNWITAGGRVLGVTATGESVAGAVAAAYEGVDKIRFEGAHFRRDIGHRAIERERGKK